MKEPIIKGIKHNVSRLLSKKFLELTNNNSPDVAVILGSGLTNFFDDQDIIESVSYEELEDFPQPTVKGHAG